MGRVNILLSKAVFLQNRSKIGLQLWGFIFLVIFLFGTTLTGSSCSAAGRQPESKSVLLSVGSLNLHLLWDTTCDSGSCGAGQWEKQFSVNELRQKVNLLKADIELLNPDVLLVQEVESQASLSALRDALEGYPYGALAESGGNASIDTGVLSKLPLVEVKSHDISTIYAPGARLMIEATVVKEGKKAILFGVHLQSKVSDRKGVVRKNQLENALRIIEDKRSKQPNALVVLGGDFNDSFSVDPKTGFFGRTWVARAAPTSEDWTYNYRGNKTPIDHLFYAPIGALADPLFVLHHTNGTDHAGIRGLFHLK